MNYPIPVSPKEVAELRQKSVDAELVAAAIVGVVTIARSQGQSLEELISEVLKDDALLDGDQRRWLSELVAGAWEELP